MIDYGGSGSGGSGNEKVKRCNLFLLVAYDTYFLRGRGGGVGRDGTGGGGGGGETHPFPCSSILVFQDVSYRAVERWGDAAVVVSCLLNRLVGYRRPGRGMVLPSPESGLNPFSL